MDRNPRSSFSDSSDLSGLSAFPGVSDLDYSALAVKGAVPPELDGTLFRIGPEAGQPYVSALRLRLERQPLLLLSSTVRENNVVLAVDLMNPDLQRQDMPQIPHGTLHVFRSKFLWHGAYYEHLQVANPPALAEPQAVAVA